MTRDGEIALIKASMDGLSLTALGGWFVGVLPAIATVLSVVWMIIRICETQTVQTWLGRDTDASPPNPFDTTD